MHNNYNLTWIRLLVETRAPKIGLRVCKSKEQAEVQVKVKFQIGMSTYLKIA